MTRTTGPAPTAEAFLEASVNGWADQARDLLAARPEVATADLSTAAVLGDVVRVRAILADDSAAAGRPDSRGRTPLAYAVRSVWHHTDHHRMAGLLQLIRVLLAEGADPDDDGGGGGGGGGGGLVLHAARHRQPECLRMLLDAGATVEGGDAVEAAVVADDVHAVHLLVVAGADAGRSLPLAIAEGVGLAVVETLLEAGSDPDARQPDGRSSLRLAVRRGRADHVRALLRHGGHDDATPADRFIGACTHADRAAAGHILDRHPLLRDGLTDDDLAAIVDAAGHAGAHAVDVMLEFGFRLDVQRHDGATPVHSAAYAGRANLVRRLAERGADIDAPDGCRGLTPLRWALAGSIDRPAHSPDGDWRATVQALVDAGAAIDDIEVPPEPADVARVLIAHGAGDPTRRRPPAVPPGTDPAL
jgi:hypothetical protein